MEKMKILERTFLLPTDEWSTNRNVWPAVEFLDICVYLLYSPSSYTKKSLKALGGYAYFVAGYVEEVLVTKISDNMLMTAKVMCDSVVCINTIPEGTS